MTRGMSRIRVGICFWADPALIESGAFYPRKSMSAEARLRHYASVFDTVEVNASYYAIPDVRTTGRWVDRPPPGFVFNVKAYALLTGHHPRPESLPADVRALLPRQPRRTRRGEIDAAGGPPPGPHAPVSPPSPAARLEYLASLPGRLPGLALAVEFRHRSWLPEHAAATLGALRAARLAHVVVGAP